MTLEGLTPFLLTSLLIELTPGPNMAYLALVSATQGRRFGFATTAGVALGLLVIGLLAALGVGKIVSTSPALFQILRWAGVFYMVYLAWAGWHANSENSPARQQPTDKLARYFRHGLIINLLNPKAGLFFIAILPTFLSPDPMLWEAPTLLVLYVIIATIIHLVLVIFCAQLHPLLSDETRNSVFRKALSISLLAVAAWMVWVTRGGL
ncbi:LysE family translocator [Algimonas porphyrae]|uniref:Threonine transporter RhtB n=1 Tax=Algimonas porphyrae TaxID=1128113 RepID=A0ABQ5V2N8_9PROT|nr:LysE family translocator [Algimonas porphyrae]GLQ21342.1 threonine transporter RhtB [Algimonas porphyrae]